MSLVVIILAAGQGTRMKSSLPKVLQPLAGRPLLQHVTDAARALSPKKIVIVYGHGGDTVQHYFRLQSDLNWAEQAQQLGTGHAVQQAVTHIDDDDSVLILYGDVPLIESTTLTSLLESVSTETLGLLTVDLDNPHGYGRVIRDEHDSVIAIIEEKDADDGQRGISEINTGIMAFQGAVLKSLLDTLHNNNSQGEYYLTDVIASARKAGLNIVAQKAQQETEVMGVNDKRQLAQLERVKQQQLAEALMLQGVTIIDPQRIDIRGQVNVGRDVSIDVDVVLEGEVTLGDGVTIGPFSHIINSTIDQQTRIQSHTVIENSQVGAQCSIGPYARIRPQTVLETGAKVGNFVETKKSRLGKGSKVNHLSYIGDADVGDDVNIGAGTITCNYDGANKHQTVIGDNAFIGSNSALVAPVKIGKGATIGAGSTINKDVPDASLAITRSKQQTNSNWKRPHKVEDKG